MYIIRQTNDSNTRDVGMVFLTFSLPGTEEYDLNKHVSFMQIFVLPDFRRQGIATWTAAQIIPMLEANNVTIAQTFTTKEAGIAFCERLGGSVALEERISRLQLQDVDWDMVQSWYDDCKSSLTNVELIQLEGLPDETDLESYCEIYTELVNQIPEGDLEGENAVFTPERMRQRLHEVKERGDRWIQFITREADGVISGITEIVYRPAMPYRCDQELTGVRQTHRGRGLGKYIKTAMLLFIRDEFPDLKYVITGNASINAPMLSINERLGFKPYKHEKIYKMQVSDMKARLS